MALYNPDAPAHANPARIPSGTPDRSSLQSVQRDVMIAMPDGVRLAADIYLPHSDGPVPAMLTRLPYGKHLPDCMLTQLGDFWTSKGYAFVAQDVRGKWASEGDFDPGQRDIEVNDGYHTLDWLARQSWSNGRLGMAGESYYGFTSMAGAVSQHPALRCIAPGNIALDRYRIAFRNGALQLNAVGYWALAMLARESNDLSRVDLWHLPLVTLAQAAGIESSYFEHILRYPTRSAIWNERSLLDAFEKIRIPVLQWGGWYDNILGPLLNDWQRFVAEPAPGQQNHLMIGPWDHDGSNEHTKAIGDADVSGSGQDRWDTLQAFFDRHLMGLADAPPLAPVRAYCIGTGAWRDFPSWPPPDAAIVPFYLHGDGHLDRIAPGDEPPDSYLYDPADPVAPWLGRSGWALADLVEDLGYFDSRRDVLFYTGESLAEDLEITGPISARLFISSSAPDTDFTVALVDLHPDGRGVLIQDGIQRTSARDGVVPGSRLEPGQVYPLDVDLWASSYLVKAGHRLRVLVSSSCFDRYDRNLNDGQPFGRSDRPLVATQTLHHAGAQASCLLLPLRPSA